MEIEKHICREEGGTIKGTSIHMTGDEVAIAIEAWLLAHGVHIRGPRTITVNRDLCDCGNVFVDPSGHVIANAPAERRDVSERTPPAACSGCTFFHDGERCSYRLEERKPTDSACVEYCPNASGEGREV